MLGLFGTLNMASRSLQTQRNGTEVAGHNLANVNTPGYARQRVAIETSPTINSDLGAQGTGADAVAIVQLRDALIDRSIVRETSVRGAYEARQQALQLAQAALGQQVDRQASDAAGSAAAQGVGGQHGIAEELSELFAAFQSVSTDPTSEAERQVLLLAAGSLATQFNEVSRRLSDLGTTLNESLVSDVGEANSALTDIAQLNSQIIEVEMTTSGVANDLRDRRQARIEDLAKLIQFDSVQMANGAINISVDGVQLVDGGNLSDTLDAYDPGNGQLLIRTSANASPINPTGGSMQGTIDARDNDLVQLQGDLDGLAATLISRVNEVHSSGFGMSGTTGEPFFTGSSAVDIGVNQVLVNDPSRIQASGVSGNVGDNSVILELAQLADQEHSGLNNQTFSESFSRTVSQLGESLHGVNTRLSNQEIVERMLLRQRDSVSGVSLDEEMTDLIRFQRAFEASARLITTIDQMLDTVVNLKR